MQLVGVGTEIVECLRIAQLIERHGEQFIQRVYTPAEIDYCSSRKQAIQHYAARWAAKEAVLKALGSGWVRGIRWKDIEIRVAPGRRYSVAIGGGVRDLVEARNVADITLSLSFCRTHATATAIATGADDSDPDLAEPDDDDLLDDDLLDDDE